MGLNNKKNERVEEKKIIKSKASLTKLKCDFFLERIFNNLKTNKSLEIIKYNKKIQKILNLTINDYKEFSELYTPIEFEIIPAKNKFGNFIKDFGKEIDYFHIYFNDEKEEIKRNYITEKEKIKKIKIIID